MVSSQQLWSIIPAWSDPELLCRTLAGHPLIAYSIAASIKSMVTVKTFVVSHDEQVARLSKAAGADIIPYTLPDSVILNSDQGIKDHLLSVILDTQAERPDIVLWLDPLYPLRSTNLLDQAIGALNSQEHPSVIQSVSPLTSPGTILWTANMEGELERENSSRSLFAQTGHIFAQPVASIRGEEHATKEQTISMMIDPAFSPDLRQGTGWQWAEWTLQQRHSDLVYPGHVPRPLPGNTSLLVMDFDGVVTDNRVWVNEEGHEMVAAYRSDSLGLSYLREAGIEAMVLSMETNPVVTARCRKMKIPVLQGINDKATTLESLLQERHIDPARVVFLGNDTNDVPCFPLVGCAVVVADAQPMALREADVILTHRGGYGAVRELIDRLLEINKRH